MGGMRRRPVPRLAGARLAVLLALLTALPALARAAEPPPPAAPLSSVSIERNVAYVDGAGARQRLDLYLPRDRKSFPVVVWYHGGGWTVGHRRGILGRNDRLGRALASRGIGVAFAGYRLFPRARHPDHVRDAARAFAWVRTNVARRGGRPDEIFVGGHSAGGHLATLLALHPKYLKEVGETPRAIRGVIGLSGVYDLPGRWPLTKIFPGGDAARGDASPVRHGARASMPFLLLAGDDDFPTADRQMFALRDAIGAHAAALVVPNRTHMSILWEIGSRHDLTTRVILAFVARHRGAEGISDLGVNVGRPGAP